jgi:hypothetical protein
MSCANVIPFPLRDPAPARVRDRYLVRHEEKTDVCHPDGPGRVINIKKTFFDGHERVELVFEKQAVTDDDMRAFLSDVDSVVTQYFSS